ncbi:Heat shock protein 70 family [Cynara cardunculus var. scolymus]|uniref:Heat shock protein 70 family n=1 Tax=Cynara cardunculus var. scolymus TaxID=59895 RepID=A0A124SAZ2_CYNCS|nr:Heat shock protein 70 family [Cynara cardunculus var. scolymus]
MVQPLYDHDLTATKLIGRKVSDEVVQEDIKLWPFEVVAGSGNKPKIVVKYKDEKKDFLLKRYLPCF